MKKKFLAFGCLIVALSMCSAISLTKAKIYETDVTTATAKVHYAENNETTGNGSLGDIVGDVVGGIGDGSGLGDSLGNLGDGSLGDIGSGSSGGLGDAIGGIGDSIGGIGDSLGDVFGGLLGGSGEKTTAAPAQTTAADIGLIIPVPAATQNTTEATEKKTTEESKVEGETVDYAATSNPYSKPTGTYSAGDEDEAIKWIQWIFIYTHYGLSDDGITGILDEDTVAIVKKLQHENGLNVDGNITEDVIKAAEILYYQKILGDDVSAIEVSSEGTTAPGVSYESVESEKDNENDVPVALLIVVLVIVWMLAIGGIVLLFVFKKKKTTAKKAQEAAEAADKTKPENKDSISSIADLFEEVEEKR